MLLQFVDFGPVLGTYEHRETFPDCSDLDGIPFIEGFKDLGNIQWLRNEGRVLPGISRPEHLPLPSHATHPHSSVAAATVLLEVSIACGMEQQKLSCDIVFEKLWLKSGVGFACSGDLATGLSSNQLQGEFSDAWREELRLQKDLAQMQA